MPVRLEPANPAVPTTARSALAAAVTVKNETPIGNDGTWNGQRLTDQMSADTPDGPTPVRLFRLIWQRPVAIVVVLAAMVSASIDVLSAVRAYVVAAESPLVEGAEGRCVAHLARYAQRQRKEQFRAYAFSRHLGHRGGTARRAKPCGPTPIRTLPLKGVRAPGSPHR